MKRNIAAIFTCAAVLALVAGGCAQKTTKVTETPRDTTASASQSQTGSGSQAGAGDAGSGASGSAGGAGSAGGITGENVGQGGTSAAGSAAAGSQSEAALREARAKEELVAQAKGGQYQASSSLETIHFDYDKSVITDVSKMILDKNYEYLAKNQNVQVLVVGHCDERGTNEYNLALGDRRANSTRAYLSNRGVSPARMETLSKGEEEPVDPGHTEEAWAKNRRAQFLVKK